jgi:hypothetical protein
MLREKNVKKLKNLQTTARIVGKSLLIIKKTSTTCPDPARNTLSCDR